jgi:hypothetical protein
MRRGERERESEIERERRRWRSELGTIEGEC